MLATDQVRRLIPRWRTARITICTGELDTARSGGARNKQVSDFFEKKLKDWEEEQSIAQATEVVAAAIVEGFREKGQDAARYIIDHASEVSETVKLLAYRVLDLNVDISTGTCSEQAILRSSDGNSSGIIKSTRELIVRYPRNALLWVDLARAYTIIGLQRQAIKSMEVALALQPVNRFVLRSAARMFVHFDDPERAHDLLKRNETVRRDPWVLAAEISVGMIAKHSSRNVRSAKTLLSNYENQPLQITELAGSLATLELYEGATRQARKLFETSMLRPTENSVAQAWWASKLLSNFKVEQELLKTPLSFEARAREKFSEQNWKQVIEQCQNWSLDEPFSSRPIELATYVAAEAMEDYVLCEQLARKGLTSNPDDQTLKNNLIYALANQGKISEAREELQNVRGKAEDIVTSCTLLATEGLLNYQEGSPELGRQFYREAMELAKRHRLRTVRASAAVHLARAEILSKTESKDVYLKLAEDECKQADDQEVNRLFSNVKAMNKKSRTNNNA